VSWGSTCLVDALYAGIIPISVSGHDDHHVNETVFPVRRCSLAWPDDQPVMEAALSSREIYASTVRRLLERENESDVA